ncbi:hypothetical protein M231_04799 [Tremella mesenterica]|uniref:Uncharacterized protein n=1 Tax=Tremella mesenterica TaxID=5217 RepID=A0A4Q1BJW9_TREME|nr:uncharacterized protein TREMEDRAFT_64428 [Tremella mesenterica DSM 1558]EIW67188.1 hypothetical protein TREMEDRAFT_64428 [Tremella mesenterica DSM 1558]RXK37910.1 hypothetical protein M231_04799 [Tremella mesenterica]
MSTSNQPVITVSQISFRSPTISTAEQYQNQLSVLDSFHNEYKLSIIRLKDCIQHHRWSQDPLTMFSLPIGRAIEYANLVQSPPSTRPDQSLQERAKVLIDYTKKYDYNISHCFGTREGLDDDMEENHSNMITRYYGIDLLWGSEVLERATEIVSDTEKEANEIYIRSLTADTTAEEYQAVKDLKREATMMKEHLEDLENRIEHQYGSSDDEKKTLKATVERIIELNDRSTKPAIVTEEMMGSLDNCQVSRDDFDIGFGMMPGKQWTGTYFELKRFLSDRQERAGMGKTGVLTTSQFAALVGEGNLPSGRIVSEMNVSTGSFDSSRGQNGGSGGASREKKQVEGKSKSGKGKKRESSNSGLVESSVPQMRGRGRTDPKSATSPSIVVEEMPNQVTGSMESEELPGSHTQGSNQEQEQEIKSTREDDHTILIKKLQHDMEEWTNLISSPVVTADLTSPVVGMGCKIFSQLSQLRQSHLSPSNEEDENIGYDALNSKVGESTNRLLDDLEKAHTQIDDLSMRFKGEKEANEVLQVFKTKTNWMISRLRQSVTTNQLAFSLPPTIVVNGKKPQPEAICKKLKNQISKLSDDQSKVNTLENYVQWRTSHDESSTETVVPIRTSNDEIAGSEGDGESEEDQNPDGELWRKAHERFAMASQSLKKLSEARYSLNPNNNDFTAIKKILQEAKSLYTDSKRDYEATKGDLETRKRERSEWKDSVIGEGRTYISWRALFFENNVTSKYWESEAMLKRELDRFSSKTEETLKKVETILTENVEGKSALRKSKKGLRELREVLNVGFTC